MRRVLAVLGVCVVVFLAANLVAGLVWRDDWAFDAARARVEQERGRKVDVVGTRSRVSFGILNVGRRATVEFDVRDGGAVKTLRVRLSKPVSFVGWRVVGYEEVTPE
jgi:hypothetical protein